MAILYGDEGVELIWVTWIWFIVATILFAIRSFNASRARDGVPSLIGVRWDFLLIAVAFVSAARSHTYILYRGNPAD